MPKSSIPKFNPLFIIYLCQQDVDPASIVIANSVSSKVIFLKGNDNKNYGKLSVEDNKISITLLNQKNQIIINPDNIQFLELNDSTDKLILKIPNR